MISKEVFQLGEVNPVSRGLPRLWLRTRQRRFLERAHRSAFSKRTRARLHGTDTTAVKIELAQPLLTVKAAP